MQMKVGDYIIWCGLWVINGKDYETIYVCVCVVFCERGINVVNSYI